MKRKVKEPESLKMLKEAFKVFDCSGDGLITREYMKLSILNTGDSSSVEVDEMLEVLDTDKDGNIQLDDFLTIFIQPDSSSSCKSADSSWCCMQ